MKYSIDTLKRIFSKTTGRCHICGKMLAFSNYGCQGVRGAWEVEHSKPRSKNGTNHLNNLYIACIGCNRSKSSGSTRAARARHERKRAPLSTRRRQEAKKDNAAGGGVLGTLIGGMIGGPAGALVGAAIGIKIGYDGNPDEDE